MADPSSLDPESAAYARHHGQQCAHVRWSGFQITLAVILPFAAAALIIQAPVQGWVIVSTGVALLSAATLGLRLLAMALSAYRDPSITISAAAKSSVNREALPRYAILVPLYREPEVVPDLLRALIALDYPTDRIDIQILLEADDSVTRDAFAAHELPGYLRITLAPPGLPRTKPRACNVGLRACDADLLVIYDAEDRPDPDQLLCAALAYRDLPDSVVCLQGRLDHYNSQQSLPARWTSIDYLLWFRLVLPGLQQLGAPIPLGGTSNHFRVAALRELGGWDPFNVTEDCDLGMRIARRGWSTRMLASTTWEEAVATPRAWIRQRSRWIKGYLQTWMVHARPGRGSLGILPFCFMSLNTIGLVGALLLNPIAWITVLLWLAIGWSIVDSRSVWSIVTLALSGGLLLSNLLVVGTAVITCLRVGRRDLMSAALLSPFAWVLQSLAAVQAVWEYIARPFHWQKTLHGQAVLDATNPVRKAPRTAVLASISILGSLALMLLAGWRIGDDLAIQAAARLPDPPPIQGPLTLVGTHELAVGLVEAENPRRKQPWQVVTAENPPPCGIPTVALQAEANFPATALELVSTARRDLSNVAAIAFDVLVPADAAFDLRAAVHWRDEDAHWFEQTSDQRLVPGQWTRLEFPLQDRSRWQGLGHLRTWHQDLLTQVHELGIRFFSARNYRGPLTIAHLRTIAFEQRPAARCSILAAPTSVACMQAWNLTADLGQSWSNPFDPDVVAVDCQIRLPDGNDIQIPSYYQQNYRRDLRSDHEVLEAMGSPSWQVRYRPRQAGTHQWRLLVREANTEPREVATGSFRATAAATPSHGYIQRNQDKPELFSWEDGTFFYPFGHNVCHAVDQIPPLAYSFTVPPDLGSFTFDRYFAKMEDAGMNTARIWMTPWSYGLEGRGDWQGFHGAGRYNLGNAWKLDHLLDDGEQRGIHVILTINHMSEFNSSWSSKAWFDSALNATHGGPLRRPEEFFTNPEVMRLYRQRLRYIVARWGDRPNILAWEFFGEANLMPGFDPVACAAWHDSLQAYVRELDQYHHLIFTHTHNWQRGHELWRLPGIDCVQGNGYIRPPNDSTNHVFNFDRYLAEVVHYHKPVLVAEFGGRSELGAPSEDYLIGQLHSGIWASFVRPFAGLALHWWWNFVDGADGYAHYRGLARFAIGIDRLQRDYRPVKPPITASQALGVAGMQDADSGFYWIYHPAIFESWADIPTAENVRLILSGLRPGTYSIEIWDTVSGTITAQRTETLAAQSVITLPSITRDLALKVLPLTEPDRLPSAQMDER